MVFKASHSTNSNILLVVIDFLLLKKDFYEHYVFKTRFIHLAILNAVAFIAFIKIRFEPMEIYGKTYILRKFDSRFILKYYALPLCSYVFGICSYILIFSYNRVYFVNLLFMALKSYMFSYCYNMFFPIFYVWTYDKLFYFFVLDFLHGCSLIIMGCAFLDRCMKGCNKNNKNRFVVKYNKIYVSLMVIFVTILKYTLILK